MTAGVLVVVDVQHVFADAGSPWGAPRFGEVHPAAPHAVGVASEQVDPAGAEQPPGR